jgi:hypothetical protein
MSDRSEPTITKDQALSALPKEASQAPQAKPVPRTVRIGRITQRSTHVTWDQLDTIRRQILARADWEIAVLAIAAAVATSWKILEKLEKWDTFAMIVILMTVVTAYLAVRKAFAAHRSQAIDIVDHHLAALAPTTEDGKEPDKKPETSTTDDDSVTR